MTRPALVVAKAGVRLPRLGVWLRWSRVPLALAGMGVAAYLTFVHYVGLPLYCEGVSGCHTVQSSAYATLLGVPVALLGLVLYGAILGAALFALRDDEAGRTALFALFGLALAGTLYSAYLTWLELYRIYAVCMWCVASASILGLLLLTNVVELATARGWREGA